MAKEDEDRVPIPDPTLLTTQQLIRELGALREIIEARLNGMDKAIELIQARSDKIPSEVDTKVENLRQLHDERINTARQERLMMFHNVENQFKAAGEALEAAMESISIQFNNRDILTDKMAKAGAEALSAALQAAKEAVGKQNESSALAIAKSETATQKQLDQLQILINTKTDALDGKITDMKDRVSAIEGKSLGQTTAKETQQTNTGLIVAVFAAAIALGGLVIALIKMGG